MNDAPRDDTLNALLDVVERDREERCREIREEAEARARDIVREARRAAREQVGEAIADARRRARSRAGSARASFETEARRRRHEASRKLLDRAWDALPDALAAAWADADRRSRWLDAAIDLAARSLPPGTWRVAHPASLDASDVDRAAHRVEEITGRRPDLSEGDDIGAGVRIESGAARLDATIDGLLADRAPIEGRLLAEMTS